ncbi:hypothetical protein [Nocardia sp. CDC160]|uniref:hypothetical protein n=1 Tax=Nocardia sp. CDC160 TaxID=3112166 RepID=UPI002DB9344F|nr:hypothetical protein [Nocardia sp. CDC160]MEC3916078.1 hypothetical protein [Nocardia sp. CDC160]
MTISQFLLIADDTRFTGIYWGAGTLGWTVEFVSASVTATFQVIRIAGWIASNFAFPENAVVAILLCRSEGK